MGWGRGWGWALLAALLVPGPALHCPRCGPGGCWEEPCPSPHAGCRRTTLRALAGGRVLRREDGGCDVSGGPSPPPPLLLLLTFRSHGEVVTLREERCGGGEGRGCPSPTPPAPHPEGRPLLCLTCDTSDGSCRPPLRTLPCPHPDDYCLDVITRGPAGGGEGRLRGCGAAGACRGLLALDTGRGRQVALRCCRRERCEPEADPPPSGLRCWACDGPEPHGCDPQVLPCGGGLTHCALARTHGPSGEPWLVRGCASQAWCETPVGLGGGGPPHCCRGALCNRLPHDPPSAAAPPPHGGLLLLLGLLLAAPHL